MRWRTGRRSKNIEDRRGMGGGGGFGRPRIRIGGRRGFGGSIGTIAVILIASYFLGFDPGILLQGGIGGGAVPTRTSAPAPRPAAENQLADFVSVVLADTEDTWHPLFRQIGRSYQEPKLVLFDEAVRSHCGTASAAVGPFYCPADQQVYIDLGFFDDLGRRFGAPGDFARAYVVAHEIGHHVQTLLGISRQVREARGRVSRTEGNRLQVRMELQADCFAGLWAHHADRARNILERGDVEEALTAAAAIGDDRIQRRTQGQVVPDSFTHGSSEQRVRWFRRGLDTGSIEACDSFRAATL